MKTDRRNYKIGGHRFALDIKEGMLSEEELENYAPFRTESSFGGLKTESSFGDEILNGVDFEVGSIHEAPIFHLTLDEFVKTSDELHTITDPGGVKLIENGDENGRIAELEVENGNVTLWRTAKGDLIVSLKNVNDAEVRSKTRYNPMGCSESGAESCGESDPVICSESGAEISSESDPAVGGVDGEEICRIWISKDYREAKAWIGASGSTRKYALDTSLMLAYAFASSKFETLLVHASAVVYEGKGYLFLGRSGTGKSTHSRLWIENIIGAELLNDDNPILRIENGEAYAYGSPWSGKTRCYYNKRVPIRGIIRLKQSPRNRITSLTGINGYASLLPSCSGMKWDKGMSATLHETISKVIGHVAMYHLECRPDAESAHLCYETVNDGGRG